MCKGGLKSRSVALVTVLGCLVLAPAPLAQSLPLDQLIAQLSDPAPGIRSTAALTLADIVDTRSADALVSASGDPAAVVRAAVMGALGKLKYTQTTPTLVAGLQDAEPGVRAAAATALGTMPSADAVAPLAGALSDSDAVVRDAAARALGQFKDAVAVTALLGSLSDSSLVVRMDTARSLGRIGDIDTMPQLVRAMETDPDPLVREAAARSVGGFGASGFEWLSSAALSERSTVRAAAATGLAATGDARSVAVLAPLMTDADSGVRLRAIWALGELKQVGALPLLLVALEDPEHTLRGEAANAIPRLGTDAIPALIQALRAGNPSVREGAVQALAQMETPAVTPLVEALADPNADVRVSAAEALISAVGEQPLDASNRDRMVQALHDDNPRVRSGIVRALGRSPGADLVTFLTDRLRDDDALVRAAAVDSLLGAPAPPPVQVFVGLLGDPDLVVRKAAAEAVARLADSSTLGALARTLKDDTDWQVRYWAANGLGKLGPPADAPLIDALSHDPEWPVRAEAARQLGAMKSRNAIGALAGNLASKDWDLADTVAQALQAIGQPAVPALRNALGHRDAAVRELAAESLGAIRDPATVNVLIASLSDTSGLVRTAAAAALGGIGEPAAQPLLAAAQQRAGSARRDAAVWALRFLEGGPRNIENHLRSYYRASGMAAAYAQLVSICNARYCLESYTWPDFPVLGLPPGARRFDATLAVDSTGSVVGVAFDDPRLAGLAGAGIASALRSWTFGHFATGVAFPVQHRLSLEFSFEGRSRYGYGRPWVEFGIERVRIVTHAGLPYID